MRLTVTPAHAAERTGSSHLKNYFGNGLGQRCSVNLEQ